MTSELNKAVLLVECVHRHSETGKVDWDAVATERKIPSSAAARMQYQRLITKCKKAEEEEANGGGGGGADGKGKKRKAGAAGKGGKGGRAKRGKKEAAGEEARGGG